MSSISVDAPTIRATADNMKDFLSFVYMNELLLKQYGAIKIIPPDEFQTAKKKTRIKLMPSTMTQQVVQLNKQDFIYTVDSVPCFNEKDAQQSFHINEADFWLSLSYSGNPVKLSSVSEVAGTSFFLKRVHRTDFDIHQLPRRSLLRLCGKDILRQFVPSLIRAHGPGAIFPLASGQQRLLSLNYHHEGGARYWYIVPASERTALERLFQYQKPSVCLEHGRILFDPLMFNKYKIRYHRLTQKPNEIVILGAGVLSQSFTDDANWSETIYFALPSWLNDGHADVHTSCGCESDNISEKAWIDSKLFHPGVVQRYIINNLNNLVEERCLPTTDEQNVAVNEITMICDTPSESLDLFSKQVADSCRSDNSLEIEGMDDEKHLNLCNEPVEIPVQAASNKSSSSTTSPMYSTSLGLTNELSELSSSKELYEDRIEKNATEPRCLSFQEILDILATPPNTITSTECQTEELINDQGTFVSCPSAINRSISSTSIENSIELKRNRTKLTRNAYKTLVIHNMRNDVTASDIRRYFVGCTKVTIKHNYMLSHLKYVSKCFMLYHKPYFVISYAFVLHRERRNAECNLKQPINNLVFGSNCYVEFMNKNIHRSRICHNTDLWNVVVRGIPLNVTEPQLRNLFIGCHLMKFIPARVANPKRAGLMYNTQRKVLFGYAFLHYTSTEEAVNVVKDADKFQINNQPLTVTFYDAKQSSWEQNKLKYFPQSTQQSHYS